MTLAAGTLNRRLSLQRAVETPTGTGGSTFDWVEFAKVWANVRFLSGSETIRSDFPVSVTKASIRIRWREDVDATCRAIYVNAGRTVTCAIEAVLPDEQGREYLDLVAEVGLEGYVAPVVGGETWDGGATWDGGTLWS